MTEECMREIFTPVAVCSNCRRKLTIYELHPTYKQNWLLKHELSRRLVHECKYCGCELEEQGYIRESVNIKGAGNMDIKNLTESEQQDLYRLLKKMGGEEPDKEQNTKGYPKYRSLVYFVNMIGEICTMTWFNSDRDIEMWELGNVFFTEEEAEFAREKRKVEVELKRYAEEHNSKTFGNRSYCIRYEEDEKRLLCDTWATAKLQGVVMFTSREVLSSAIETVGKDRILKYIFGVESEGE